MEPLERELLLADLRARDEVTAVVTDVEDVDHYSEDHVEVSYRITEGEVTEEAFDPFPVPDSDSEEFEFVRLCRDCHVPLDAAHEDLVDSTVPVRWEGNEWSIVVPERESGPGGGGRSVVDSLPVEDRLSAVGFLVGAGAAYPLLSPLVFLHLWPRRGVATALGATGALLAAWLGVAVAVSGGVPF